VLAGDPSMSDKSNMVVVETSVTPDVVVLIHDLRDTSMTSTNLEFLQVLFFNFEF